MQFKIDTRQNWLINRLAECRYISQQGQAHEWSDDTIHFFDGPDMEERGEDEPGDRGDQGTVV